MLAVWPALTEPSSCCGRALYAIGLMCLASVKSKQLPQERVGLIQQLQTLGYRAWAFGEDPRLSKRNVEYSVGGIVAAVREDMRATCEEHLIHDSGEAVLINMFSCHVGFLWRRPHVDHEALAPHSYRL